LEKKRKQNIIEFVLEIQASLYVKKNGKSLHIASATKSKSSFRFFVKKAYKMLQHNVYHYYSVIIKEFSKLLRYFLVKEK